MFSLTRQERILLFSLIFIFVLGLSLFAVKRFSGIDVFQSSSHNQVIELKSSREDLLVLVKGAVQDPGVYRVGLGTRLIEAIQKATPLPQADLLGLPLAEFVKDGQTIVVPGAAVVQEKPVSIDSQTPPPKEPVKININVASVIELDGLPGIGPGLATRIIDYRKEHVFTCVDDLLKVPGIGQKKFEDLKDKVCIK